MRFTAIAAIGALAGTALADYDPTFDFITNPSKNEKVAAGSVYTIKWQLQQSTPVGPVNITLIGGPEQDKQVQQAVIASEYNVSRKRRPSGTKYLV
jgi:hypothetical protein